TEREDRAGTDRRREKERAPRTGRAANPRAEALRRRARPHYYARDPPSQSRPPRRFSPILARTSLRYLTLCSQPGSCSYPAAYSLEASESAPLAATMESTKTRGPHQVTPSA